MRFHAFNQRILAEDLVRVRRPDERERYAAAQRQARIDANPHQIDAVIFGAIYPSHAIRFSILWKAEVRDNDSKPDSLNLDRIMAIFTADLRHRGIDCHLPSDPLADTTWILLLQQVYVPPTATPGG